MKIETIQHVLSAVSNFISKPEAAECAKCKRNQFLLCSRWVQYTSFFMSSSFDTVLSVYFNKDRVGACIYRDEMLALETCEFWDHGPLVPTTLSEAGSFGETDLSSGGDSYPALRTLLKQVVPTLLLVSVRSPETLIYALEDHIKDQLAYENPIKCDLKQLKINYYSYEHACSFLSSLNLPTDVVTRVGRESISSFLNFEEDCLVRASGALVRYLLEEKVGTRLSASDSLASVVSRDQTTGQIRFESGSHFRVASLSRLELDGRLHLESHVYDYLQIFHADQHPSAFGGAPKEGISVFSMFSRACSSKLGVTTLKQWLLAPLCDPYLINARLDCIDVLWKWLDEETRKTLSFHLQHVCDLRLAVSRLSSGTFVCRDWISLKEFCIASLRVREMLETNFSDRSTLPPLLLSLSEMDMETMVFTARLISESLDLDPKKDRKPQIRGGVDSELDRLRSVHADLDGFLDDIALRELAKFPGVKSLRVIYVPQMGFQLALPQSEGNLPSSETEKPSLQFESDQYRYYRTKTTQELNELLGDVLPAISDRCDVVLRSIAQAILPLSSALFLYANWLAELDVLMAMTQKSKENRFVRPIILNPIEAFTPTCTEHLHSGTIRVVNGRHPLLEHIMSTHAQRFVSNSTQISLWNAQCDLDSSTQIITGPNGSGKSVYLTQLGLIVFFAHIGCYVPADEAEISVIDHLFTLSSSSQSVLPIARVQTNDAKIIKIASTSTGSECGSFMNDVHKLGRILRHATPLSLILIDEFGRGTTESDAASLLLASIDKFCTPRPLRTVDSEGNCIDSQGSPKTLISTHLKLLHSPLLQQYGNQIQCYHMNVVLPSESYPKSSRHKEPLNQENEFNSLFLSPTFLYRLMPVTDEYQPLQLGLFCAKVAGMPSKVLERARAIKLAIFRNESLEPLPSLSHSTGTTLNSDERATYQTKVSSALEKLENNFGRDSLSSTETIDALTFLETICAELEQT